MTTYFIKGESRIVRYVGEPIAYLTTEWTDDIFEPECFDHITLPFSLN